MREFVLSSAPNPLGLLLSAGFKRAYTTSADKPALPAIKYTLDKVTIDLTRLERFHQTVDWQQSKKNMHPCFPHIVAFPLHLKLMLDKAFPFALLGLVHIENTIEQVRPLHASEVLKVSCQFGSVEKHSKGWAFTILTEVSVGSEPVWFATSRNLYRVPDVNEKNDKPKQSLPVLETAEFWSLEKDLGRRYSRVSGDYNPIHLYRIMAKAMGFKQPIVHGMWSQARCLSALHEQTDEPFSCACKFVKPAFLPGKVNFNVDKVRGTQAFSLTSQSKPATEKGIIHLSGKICPLKGSAT